MLTSFLVKHGKVIMSACLYQGAWLSLVFSSVDYSLYILSIFSALHFLFVCRRVVFWVLSLLTALLGCSIDFLLSYLGLIDFEHGFPFWLFVLWFVFASSLPFAFGFLMGRYRLASILGAAGAALAYFVAISARGDVGFGTFDIWGLAFIAAYWAVFLPVTLKVFKLGPVQTDLQPT